MARGGFSKKSKNQVSLQLSHFYCAIKYISLQMLPRNTIHENRNHHPVMWQSSSQCAGNRRQHSFLCAGEDIFTGATRRLELLISSLKHKQVVSGSVD